MPSDVREMSDRELLQDLMAACLGFHQAGDREVEIGKTQTRIELLRDELARRLSALRAEVESLKAEDVIKTALCEAIAGNIFTPDGCRRYTEALADYRAMKEVERNAETPRRWQPKVKLDPKYVKRLTDAD